MLTLPYVFISAVEVESERDEILVYVNIDPPSQDQIVVDFAITGMVANKVATPGEDYYLQGAYPGVYGGTITFAPEEIECEFIIGVVDDTAYEGQEWLRISLSNPVNAQFVGEDELFHDSSNADTFITDYEDPYVVISAHEGSSEPPSAEDSSYALFDVQLLGGDEYTQIGSVDVSWATAIGAGDTATGDQDFQSAAGSVTTYLDDEPATIQIPIHYDGSGEDDETFRVSLTGATNGITVLVDEAVATIFDAIAVPVQEPPPDCQCGAEVGRSVTSITSDHGFPFWEGDSVKFTAGLSDNTPRAGETFKWQRRPLLKITLESTKEYGEWEMLPGSGNSPDANTLFSDPFTGEVRVELTSLGTISSRSMDVRASAAYPVNFQLTTPMPHLDHRRLAVTYSWSSSSGRLGDLDGVKMGEFVWMTDEGFYKGHAGQFVPKFVFPDPPFDREENNGFFVYTPTAAVLAGAMTDFHGGGNLSKGSNKSQDVQQYYWYEITDAGTYMAFVDGRWQRISDDARGKQPIGGINTIHYSVSKVWGTELWKYNISKWNSSGESHGSEDQFIDKDDFPWDAATN